MNRPKLHMAAWALLILSTLIMLPHGQTSEGDAAFQEALRLSRIAGAKSEARAHRALLGLIKCKPVVKINPESLSLHGDGLDDFGFVRRYTNYLSGPFGLKGIILAKGTLYLIEGNDFEKHIIRYHFDPSHGYKQDLDETYAQVKLFSKSKHQPAAQKAVTSILAAYRSHMRGPEDLLMLEAFVELAPRLTGKNWLNSHQLNRMRQAFSKKIQTAEALKKLVQSTSSNELPLKTVNKIFALMKEMNQSHRLFQPVEQFYTPGQLTAMGFGKRRRRRSVVATASSGASAGGTTREAIQETTKTEQAKKKEKEKENTSTISFAISTSTPGILSLTRSWRLATGTLTINFTWDEFQKKVRFNLAFNRNQSWAIEKLPYLQSLENYDPKGPKEKKKTAVQLKQTKSSKSWHEYILLDRASELLNKPGARSEELEDRLTAMILEYKTAEAQLTGALTKIIDKKGIISKSQKHELFSTLREFQRITVRQNTLTNPTLRNLADPGNLLTHLPWLMSLDEIDESRKNILVDSSMTQSGSDGAIMLRARPSGKNQFVSINAPNSKLGSLSTFVQQQARTFYWNHKLTLEIDPTVKNRPIRGKITGKSAEELFKSLATRSGTKLQKHANKEFTYILKL